MCDDLEHGLVHGAGLRPQQVVGLLQLLDGGERLCLLHHRQERCVARTMGHDKFNLDKQIQDVVCRIYEKRV